MDAYNFNGVQVFLVRQFGEDQTAILKEARKIYCGRTAFYRIIFINGVNDESIKFAFANAKHQVELDIDFIVKRHKNKLESKLAVKKYINEVKGTGFLVYDTNLLEELENYQP